VTNRSYHEKTPFHQLAHNLLQTSYSEALQARIPFEDAIGLTGQTYYKMTSDKGGESMEHLPHQQQSGQRPLAAKAMDANGNGVRHAKRERGGEPIDMHQMSAGGHIFPQGLNGMDIMRGMNNINGIMGNNPHGQLQQQVFPFPYSLGCAV